MLLDLLELRVLLLGCRAGVTGGVGHDGRCLLLAVRAALHDVLHGFLE